MHEMDFNTTWISVSPPAATVPGSSSRTVTLSFNPSELRPSVYRVNLTVHSNVFDTTMVLPVELTRLGGEAVGDKITDKLPDRYELRQNYPNPFNPNTEIRYDLRAAGLTRLSVYNILGEKVADLVNEVQPAGSYAVNFNGANLSSGVYFYRIQSGSFSDLHKMVLLK
jgi:hypothetical protein